MTPFDSWSWMSRRRVLPGFVLSTLGALVIGLTTPSPGVAIDCPPCNDNIDCTFDTCDTSTGTCRYTPYSCDDHNQCTTDMCRGNAGCSNVTGVFFCTDGNPCTAGDHCEAGYCVTTGPTPCDDGNICTGDSCNPSVGCVFAPTTGAGCSDGNACTGGDLCVNGSCQPGPPVTCNDGNACTNDSCDAQAGCYAADVTNACDDGQSCTVDDVCVEGVCTGVVTCPCVDDDGDGFAACAGACDPSGKTCGDCDDSTNDVHPGAAETCNHIDDDCDGTVDEGSEKAWESQSLDDPGGGSPGDRYGAAIAKLGDVTGDGIDDLAIGAPTTDTPSAVDAGSVIVLSGADRTVHCRVVDPAGLAGSRLGSSIAGLDDLTGDGVPDLVAGAPGAGGVGRVTIISGADCAVVRSCSDSVIGSFQVYNRLGTTVTPVGDQNGDGFPDILAGDPDPVEHGGGRAALFSGANCTVLRRLTPPFGSDGFGSALAPLGDLTFDGVDDFAVGSPVAPEFQGAPPRGAVFIYSGANGAVVRTLRDMAPEAVQGHLGGALGVLPDINGDGRVDLAVGEAEGDAGGVTDSGSVVLFSGADGTMLRRCTAPDAEAGDGLGKAIAVLPDIDGDGLADLAASAPYDDVGALVDAGSILSFSSANCSLLARLPYGGAGAVGGARLGETALTLAGNLAGDPSADLVTGNGYNAGNANAATGHACLFHAESQCAGECSPENQPGNPETCDGRDNDCDGGVDEGNPGGGLSCTTSKLGTCAAGTTYCLGGGIACAQNTFPSPEICNGLDDDCNGALPSNELDGDGDTYRPCGGDCDDSNPARHPGATEVCDLVDDDCDGILEPDVDGDGRVDCLDCQPMDPGVWASPPAVSNIQAAFEAGSEYLVWDDAFPAAGGDVYDIFSGRLLLLRNNPGHFSTGACFASDLFFNAWDITSAIPPAGDGFYFIVRARNTCGTGTYGSALRDQGAAASNLPCP